ncbi:MAG: ACT domain-containing protein [Chloroflexi bacterium]|nr:ACT domain-containing protein [Chloroflexota bacterium]MCC6891218.1 ACT domain-containing protein [Anaerolineae bacterium]
MRQALKRTSISSDNNDYAVIQLPARAITVAAGIVAEIGEAFCALIVDPYEVSLIIPQDAVGDFAGRLQGHTQADNSYRLITFDLALDFNLFGFMAAVSQALAEVQVSILPIAAYSRDHVLVPSQQFDIALGALQKLQSSV